MGLSRLDNFLKSSRGTILYVDPNSLDATDSIENQGNSLTRPFKTIQRALIEAARFSYQRGLDNDRFGNTTILLYPGDHVVDNRPGFIIDGTNQYKLRNGGTTNDLPPYDLASNFDLSSPDNELYKVNSIYGGVIIPRGTSIVGLDLRKTKVRPKYVPNPENDAIERSCLFRVTGACYLWQFSMFDGDPNGVVYRDYTANTAVPNFSHHKLACFEYADGKNRTFIRDEFLNFESDLTDLEMYYAKVGLVYGQSSGRPIEPDFPTNTLDIQPKIDETRIVGSSGLSVGITSIRSGDGTTPSNTITLTTNIDVNGLDVDTPFRVEGVVAGGYNGQFVVNQKLSSNQIQYKVQNPPAIALPATAGASLSLQSDTVTSASPYIFNISLRSVFGMCGMLADGDKVTGFKSMVVAQFTGIGLQKDDKAFVVFNQDSPPTGNYDDNTIAGNETISNNSRARYKPKYKNFHIKVTNNSIIQAVSVFAIGFAEHFVTESGGDISITNSNSNFGAKALVAEGFKADAFAQDDIGYITHIIPPKEIPLTESSLEFEAIDVSKTVGVGSTGQLFLYDQTNQDVPPENVLEGYRVGARENDQVKLLIGSDEYQARVVMSGSQTSSEKTFSVERNVSGINSIGRYSKDGFDNVITLKNAHTFANGESIRVISDDGQLPDGLSPNTVYYAITDTNVLSGLTTNRNIKIAKTFNDAINADNVVINEKGGNLRVVSRVSDKNSGDIGHPIQFDTTNNQWYVKVSTASTENTIYSTVVGLGVANLGSATPRTFISRKTDNRNAEDILYKLRYVIPSTADVSRPPTDGFILQESNTSIGSTDAEIQTYFGTGSITNVNQQRNFKFIAGANWSNLEARIDTELPHKLSIGSEVEIINVKSTLNPTGLGNSGFNRNYSVTGINSAKQFTVGLATNPGAFDTDTTLRTVDLPHFKRKKFDNTFYTYRISESQQYIAGEQDGVYYLTVLNASNSPTVTPFTEEKFSQPVKNLFPQTDRDTPNSDPDESKCFASSGLIGEVVVNDPKKSVTKETTNKFVRDVNIGFGITDLASQSGTAHTIYTQVDHGFNRATSLSIVNPGSGYGSGAPANIYNARLVGGASDGKHATAKITVNGSGTITAVKLMDGGSAYGVGNTLTVAGVAQTTGFSEAVVRVDSVYSNVGDTVKVIGISSEGYSKFNDLYRITSVTSDRTFNAVSVNTNVNRSVLGLGVTACAEAYGYLTGESIRVSGLTYDHTSGIATVTSSNAHGLAVDQKVKLTGANQSQYNGDFIVTEILDDLSLPTYSFSVRIGVGTASPSATGTIFAYREGVSSNDGIITVDNENLNGRMVANYAGITTTLSATISSPSDENISLSGIAQLDVNIGDYLAIEDEIVRIKTTVTGLNPLTVFRGVLGTRRKAHAANSVVRKIFINPVEFRRHSIIRASGHTFEYVGFGPGNYSTALPDKQDRQISADEELLAQSTKREGGINFYTGMNDKGISYSGNKKLSTITGSEEIFDTPIKTITGEDISNVPALNVISPVEGSFSRSIRVEGGADNKVASEFNGPLIVNNKITSNSPKGIEANSLFLQGDATVSRKQTVGISTPVLSGNPGDVVYYANPDEGGYVGWIYTQANDWRRFGNVSLSKDLDINTLDKLGIGATSVLNSLLRVGSDIFTVNEDGVGIGTTASGYSLNIIGDANISGMITATEFVGSGQYLTNLNAAATGWDNATDALYNSDLSKNVGIGTTVPRFVLEVGHIGQTTKTFQVNGKSEFTDTLTANAVAVGGALTAVGTYTIDNVTSGLIRASQISVGTQSPTELASFQVGSGSDLLVVKSDGHLGIGTTAPRADVDILGHARIRTQSEDARTVNSVSGEVTLDLSLAQTFYVGGGAGNITDFIVANPPHGSSTFTLVVTNTNPPKSIAIDSFKMQSNGAVVDVKWPGGVVPIVTNAANAVDIYSFKILNGQTLETQRVLYGVIGGQNFS
tara:strand:- start:1451 stop:7336 length:5886 start_codon:yes stop_codon:yes gene_type:complete